MGWDANASVKIKRDENFKLLNANELLNPEYAEAFKQASKQARKETGSVDALLRLGGLDCSTCAKMLEKATGESVYVEEWSASKVKTLSKSANWGFKCDDSKAWAYWSARLFLETCAKFNLSIQFSW